VAKPNDLTKIKKCAARTKSGKRCRADAIPGEEFCIAHKRARAIRKRKGERRANPVVAGDVDSFLHADEKESYGELLGLIQKAVGPDHAGDSLLIERLAIASVQARRFDALMKDMVDEKTTSRNLFYADTRIINLIRALGIDRRLRVQIKHGKGGNLEEVLKRWKHILGGGPGKGANGGKGGIELERDDGQTPPDESRPPHGRSGGVHAGDSESDPAREAGEVHSESGAVQERALGEEGGEEHS